MSQLTTENARIYCNNNILKLGTNIYYSLLPLKQQEKDAIAAILSFYKKIFDISNNDKDKDLNLIKLNWWKKEINNTYIAKASHPISIALTTSIKKYALEKKFFLNIIKGIQLNLNKKIYISVSEIRKFIYYTYTSISFILLKIFKCEKKIYVKYAKNISLSVHIIQIIKNIGFDIRKKKLYQKK